MKKFIALFVLVLFVWCAGIQAGKGIERERAREVRRARAERLALFAKNRSKGASWPKSIEFITDVIGDGVNLVLNK